ncbi:type II toxin-antitoxin system antitoxin SocA domain-containing protein [Proteiniphilum sp.]|uniref:type II toxin-antitoxin system antitoxin SocA domain-containing protein n=1 Tax=Proteiniphilum sp. TaxID=1926877 RepID=UPI003328DFE4
MKASPFTGGKVTLKKERKEFEFRKSKFEIIYHYYVCEDTKEEFTDTQIDELNLVQVYNQYREKEGIPFPPEIRGIRQKYGISAAKMSLILGFGTNMYAKYEAGEMPSISNGRMIKSCDDVNTFKNYVFNCADINEKDRSKILKNIHIVAPYDKFTEDWLTKMLFDWNNSGKESGYTSLSLDKAKQVVLYFAGLCRPFTTKMNKLLFYSDFLHYKRFGNSITGLNYIAIAKGPVPKRYSTLYDQTETICKEEIIFFNGNSGEQLAPQKDSVFDRTLFSKSEISILEEVGAKLKDIKTNDIVTLSHQEAAWIDNEKQHKSISYDYAFFLKAF